MSNPEDEISELQNKIHDLQQELKDKEDRIGKLEAEVEELGDDNKKVDEMWDQDRVQLLIDKARTYIEARQRKHVNSSIRAADYRDLVRAVEDLR